MTQASDQTSSGQELLEARLAAAILRHVPECREVLQIEPMTGGASRQMFRARIRTTNDEQHLALRRSANDQDFGMARLSLPVEAEVINTVRRSGVATPSIVFAFQPEDNIGTGYAMEFVTGETLGGRIVKSPQLEGARSRLAEQCGQMLARIHQVDVEATGLAGKLPKFTAQSVLEETYGIYRFCNVSEPMIDYTALWLQENLPKEVSPALTHGDFRNGNFIVTDEGLTSILDWELAAIGDPMRDLAWLCLNSWRFGASHLPAGGFGTLDSLFSAYEDESSTSVDRSRFHYWQVFGSFWWAVTCIGAGMSYRAGARRADRVAIGRRSSEAQIDLVNLLIPGPVSLSENLETEQYNRISTVEELLQSTRDDLSDQVTPMVTGKPRFITRVAISNIETVLRELRLGPAANVEELRSANVLLNASFDNVSAARNTLSQKISEGYFKIEDEQLKQHLRNSIAAQVTIDQPEYSGLREALGELGE